LDENENLSRVLAKGGVKVIQNASSSARGDEADYDHKGNVTVLTGNVTLIDDENKLSGDVAEIDFSTGISKIISSTSSGRVSGQFSRLKTVAQK
jgi:lipopolysaccharide export system protein LptA